MQKYLQVGFVTPTLAIFINPFRTLSGISRTCNFKQLNFCQVSKLDIKSSFTSCRNSIDNTVAFYFLIIIDNLSPMCPIHL